MNWFTEQRLAWIKESVEIFGAVRRENIMQKFGISTAQASLDLREVRSRWPDLIQYDLSEKAYKATSPMARSTNRRRKGIPE
jgi:hypothetical protein